MKQVALCLEFTTHLHDTNHKCWAVVRVELGSPARLIHVSYWTDGYRSYLELPMSVEASIKAAVEAL